MIVRDKKADLEQFLTAQYQAQIKKLQGEAEDFAKAQLDLQIQKANAKCKEIQMAANAKSQAYNHTTLSAARLESARLQSKAKKEFVDLTIAMVKDELHSLAKRKKSDFVKAVHESLLLKMESEGYDLNQFEFSCPTDVKIEGCNSCLDETQIVAESKTMVFRFGIEDLISQKHDELVKKTLQFVNDHTEI